jgi:hypothetical protein
MEKTSETTDLAIHLFKFGKLTLSNVRTLSGKVTLKLFKIVYVRIALLYTVNTGIVQKYWVHGSTC